MDNFIRVQKKTTTQVACKSHLLPGGEGEENGEKKWGESHVGVEPG